jgi:hypothetical protein
MGPDIEDLDDGQLLCVLNDEVFNGVDVARSLDDMNLIWQIIAVIGDCLFSVGMFNDGWNCTTTYQGDNGNKDSSYGNGDDKRALIRAVVKSAIGSKRAHLEEE